MSSIRRTVALVAGPVLSIIVASSVAGAPVGPRHGHGTFVDTAGLEVGRIRLTEDGHGIVHVDAKLKSESLSAGNHGIHIHAVGSCATTTAAFDGAGGHYNPLGHEHGLDNPNGPHAGDLPNLDVDGHGHGRLQAKTDHVTLTPGPTTLFDGDGSALIVHANPDDQVTNAGNGGSGARIACAVIVPD